MNPHATAKATCTLEIKIIRADGTIEILTVPAEVLDQDAMRKSVTGHKGIIKG